MARFAGTDKNDDRLEIVNPGRLPNELTVESLMQPHDSFPRNPEIADFMFKTTYLDNPASLMLNYKSATLNSTGGNFTTDYVRAPINIINPVTSEQELEDYIVYADDAGNLLRLKDVATVERRIQEDSPGVSCNGHTAVVVNVSVRDGKNVVKFGDAVG